MEQPAAACWTNLLETTLNKVNDILGDVCVVEEMMSTEEDMIEQAVTIDMLSDSRLDANSVLIDDIKLGEEANMEEEDKMTRDRSYSWHGGKLSSSSRNTELMDFPLSSCSSASPARSCTSSTSGGSVSLATVSESRMKSQASSGEEEERGGNSSSGESTETNTKGNKLNTRKNPWGNHSYAELIVQVVIDLILKVYSH